jgi:hypothetical protein
MTVSPAFAWVIPLRALMRAQLGLMTRRVHGLAPVPASSAA